MEFKDSVGYLISNSGRRLNQRLQQLFQEQDVTPEQWSLLMCLVDNDGISHRDLAKRTLKDPANITRLVDQLERKKLVRRGSNPNDRRSQLINITTNGTKTALTLAPVEAAFVTNLLKDISDDEIVAFKRFIAKINDNADNYEF